MGIKTGIEWTEATWNPVRGCSRISEGCRNCYAERVAGRFSGDFHNIESKGDLAPFHGFAKLTASGPRWTGKVEIVEKHLGDPLSWKKPRRIFVNSMSDLFHEALPDEAIDRVFADWVICGGESGPGARPMHPDWARSVRDQCVAAGVPFFFKQWGGYSPDSNTESGERYPKSSRLVTLHGKPCVGVANSDIWMHSAGKKAAGALLDGREWRQFPNA